MRNVNAWKVGSRNRSAFYRYTSEMLCVCLALSVLARDALDVLYVFVIRGL